MMKQRTRIVAFFGAVLLFIMSVPFASFATENAPSIGTAQNVVSKAKITLAGKDVTGQYAKNGRIIFANNQEGFINNLIFGSDNSFVYTQLQLCSYSSIKSQQCDHYNQSHKSACSRNKLAHEGGS